MGSTSSSAGTWQRSRIAGQPWNRSARAFATPSVRTGRDVARGLAVRCDWGPQYIADAWINEVKWLGITISPSYVSEPECNGVIERFMRTLRKQCLYLHRFQTLEEARQVIAAFDRYNHEWLIERLEYRDAGAGPDRGREGRGVTIRAIPPGAEGCSASRSAFEEGAAIWVFPETGILTSHECPGNRVRYTIVSFKRAVFGPIGTEPSLNSKGCNAQQVRLPVAIRA
jgi:hypothetical protein